MNLLTVPTEAVRLTVCAICKGALIMRQHRAYGAPGVGGPAVKGTFWKLDDHVCPGPVVPLGSAMGDGA